MPRNPKTMHCGKYSITIPALPQYSPVAVYYSILCSLMLFVVGLTDKRED